MKTHANLICSCSIYLGSCYGPDYKFRGVKKRCEIADIEEFLLVNLCKPYMIQCKLRVQFESQKSDFFICPDLVNL